MSKKITLPAPHPGEQPENAVLAGVQFKDGVATVDSLSEHQEQFFRAYGATIGSPSTGKGEGK